jgi:peroxiredoxin
MYNYKKFLNKEYNLLTQTGLKVGETIPDFSLLGLDGKNQNISDFFDKPIVIETGSITCGMFAAQSAEMNKLASNNSDFNFLMLYVREAHPGSLIDAHRSIDEKCNLANRLYAEDKIEGRTIVIDDIYGTVHNTLGALPNMVFIIDKTGKIMFRGDWNIVKMVQQAIDEFKVSQKPVQPKWIMMPPPNIRIEYHNYKRAGWNALWDLIKSTPGLMFSHLKGGLCFKYPAYC